MDERQRGEEREQKRKDVERNRWGSREDGGDVPYFGISSSLQTLSGAMLDIVDIGQGFLSFCLRLYRAIIFHMSTLLSLPVQPGLQLL